MTNHTIASVPFDKGQDIKDYFRVARLIELHNQAAPEAGNLQSLGETLGLSPVQVQRLFSRWAGISPKRFSQYLTAREIRARMQRDTSQLELSLDTGLSSTSLVHDHFVRFYAMSPKQAQEQGANIVIKHGYYNSPFGECHIGTTEKGICWLAFTRPGEHEQPLQQLREEWPQATLVEDNTQHLVLVDELFDASASKKPLYLHIKGSNFQLRVWEALLKIPVSQCASYQDIAQMIKAPKAARAVGTAIGNNPVSWLIPCHRVIRKSGVVGAYRWGSIRKQSLLAWEQSRYSHINS